jgi:hypothetical protein
MSARDDNEFCSDLIPDNAYQREASKIGHAALVEGCEHKKGIKNPTSGTTKISHEILILP